MKVFFDHQTFTHQNYGGISRFAAELIKELQSMNNVQTELSVLLSQNENLDELNIAEYYKLPKRVKKPYSYMMMKIINDAKLAFDMTKSDFDIFHSLYFEKFFLSFLKKRPFIQHVHDLSYEKYPEFLNQKSTTKKNLKGLVSRANRVMTVSNNTKKDLVECLGVKPEKIDVIYLASNLKLPEGYSSDLMLPERYLLFIGNGQRFGYKNFKNLLKSFSLLEDDREIHLVVSGGRPFSEKELDFMDTLKVRNRVKHYKYTNVNDLAFIYSRAQALIMPSLFEGFGIPILEAMNCGCPVVSSNTTSLPEVGGDAALYFNPHSVSEMTSQIKKVMDSESLRKRLKEKSVVNSKKFSYERMAKESIESYKKVLS